jgi:hypothetical protein
MPSGIRERATNRRCYGARMKYLLGGHADIGQVASWLDDRDVTRLRGDIEQLSRAHLLRLWTLAKDSPAIDIDHFVPGGAVNSPVHHAGRNSIPTLARWRRFEKRFALMHAGDDIVGYNEAEVGRLIGPGYFVLRRSTTPEHAARGALFVDYLSVPDGPVPDRWPAIQPNEQGLQRFIYGGTQDFMRKVSSRVSVGMPFKGDQLLPYPFVLLRLGPR